MNNRSLGGRYRFGVVLAGIALIAGACHLGELDDVAVGNQGMFDPSLTVDPVTGAVWMSYTNVDDLAGEHGSFRALTTRLATSTDGGASWTDAGLELNQSGPEPDLPAEYSAFQGGWVNEVSRLTFDPDPASTEPWMLVWHRYLHVDDGSGEERKVEYGWIAVKTAADPVGLAAAPERKLFSALAYELLGDVQYKDRWIGPPEHALHDLHPDLGSCIVATEPGMLVVAGEVFMSLVCLPPTGAGSVVLIRSSVADEWAYSATVLTPADAAAANPDFTSYSASELFAVDDTRYLMVSPNDAADGLYNGCIVFRFDSLATGALQDDNGDGLPDPLLTVLAQVAPAFETGINSGACGYSAAAPAAGIVGGKIYPLADPFARLFSTHVNVADTAMIDQ